MTQVPSAGYQAVPALLVHRNSMVEVAWALLIVSVMGSPLITVVGWIVNVGAASASVRPVVTREQVSTTRANMIVMPPRTRRAEPLYLRSRRMETSLLCGDAVTYADLFQERSDNSSLPDRYGTPQGTTVQG